MNPSGNEEVHKWRSGKCVQASQPQHRMEGAFATAGRPERTVRPSLTSLLLSSQNGEAVAQGVVRVFLPAYPAFASHSNDVLTNIFQRLRTREVNQLSRILIPKAFAALHPERTRTQPALQKVATLIRSPTSALSRQRRESCPTWTKTSTNVISTSASTTTKPKN